MRCILRERVDIIMHELSDLEIESITELMLESALEKLKKKLTYHVNEKKLKELIELHYCEIMQQKFQELCKYPMAGQTFWETVDYYTLQELAETVNRNYQYFKESHSSLDIKEDIYHVVSISETSHNKIKASPSSELRSSIPHHEIKSQYVFPGVIDQDTFLFMSPYTAKLDKIVKQLDKGKYQEIIQESDVIIRSLNDIIDTHPNLLFTYILYSYDVYNNLGIAYYENGCKEEAIRSWCSALLFEYLFVLQDCLLEDANKVHTFINISTSWFNITKTKPELTNNNITDFINIKKIITLMKCFWLENLGKIYNILSKKLSFIAYFIDINNNNDYKSFEQYGIDYIKKSVDGVTFYSVLNDLQKQIVEKINHNIAINDTESTTDEDRDIEKLGKAEKAVAYADKGIMYKRIGDYDKAIKYCKKAIETSPKNGMYYYNLGKLLYLTQKYEEAKRAYYLAYVYNARIDVESIYRHIGHAILDTDDRNKRYYGSEIEKYRDGIAGKASAFGNIDIRYMLDCVYAGKNEIDKLKKQKSNKDTKSIK